MTQIIDNLFSGERQLHSRRFTAIRKRTVSLMLLLSLLIAFLLPRPALSANENAEACSIERGLISSDNAFTASVTGRDFKLTCTGELSAKLNNESIQDLLDSRQGYVAGTSKVLIDLKGVSGETTSVAILSDAGLNVLTGTLTTDADTEVGSRAVLFGAVDANNPIKVENQATITAKGAGTRALVVENNHGGDATLTNEGTVVAEGEPHTRSTTDYPYRRGDAIVVRNEGSGSGNIMITNRGSVTAKGQGARGISAVIADPVTGNAVVHNYGTVKTEGEPWTPAEVRNISTQKYRAYGVYSTVEGGGSSEVVNQQGGNITTMGAEARGLFAYSSGTTGTATATNHGTVTTHGDGARGVSANTEADTSATTMVTNAGTITTHGDNAHGLYTWAGRANSGTENFSSASTVTASNTGTITTNGDNADGTAIYSPISEDDSSSISLLNSGTITANGVGADGLEAGFLAYITQDSDALGAITVENSGTITVNGDGPSSGWSSGISGFYWANDNPEFRDSGGDIQNSGDVMIENTGTVSASGNRGVGIYAETFGTGTSTINMRGGSVTAGSSGDAGSDTPGKFGIGITGTSNTDRTDEDAADDVDVLILVSGSSIVRAFGADEDDSSTDDYDESKGIAIEAWSGAATGHSVVTVSDGSSVTATDGYAVMFVGGKGTLNLDGATLVGDTMFTAKDDIFNVMTSGGSITGDIGFGSGDDTMSVNVDEDHSFNLIGDITGLETLNKTGAGIARFGGDVTFEGSTLNLEDGVLLIAGHMNLGSGEVTIHQAGKLTFEIDGSGNAGSITAGSVHFEGVSADEVSVYTQINGDVADDKLDDVRSSIASKTPVLIDADMITRGSGDSPVTVTTLAIQSESSDGVMEVGTVQADTGMAEFEAGSVRHIAQSSLSTLDEEDSSEETGTGDGTAAAGGGSSSDNDAILGLGLVAVLIALYWGDGLFGGSSFADEYAFNTPQSAYYASIDDRNMLTIRESGNQPYSIWIRTGQNETLNLAGVSSSGVSGTEIGLSLYRTDDFYIEAASAQNVTAQVNALNQQAQGEVYSLSSGWRNERYFAGVKLSHGNYNFNSIIHNPVVNSALLSDSEVTHTQAQFTAGTRFSTGGLEFIPSASIQAGTFDYSAHEAQGAALSAEVPQYSQDYSALRVGLKMSAGDWLNLSEETKWKPHLQLDQMRTDSERNGDISLRQRDKIGALSFNSGATIQAMPEVVSALSFGASVKSSKSNRGEWRFGYAGLEADGEYYHAAVAAYQMRF